MNYKLIFDEPVIERLNKLPKSIKKRIFGKLQDTKANPFHFFKKLTNTNLYKLRVGKYRVIAEINKS